MPLIKQPVNQIRLTNVAIVRLKRGSCTYELACYPNKVRDFRDGKETDITQVLQSDKIFTNVGKGQFASNIELLNDFGDLDWHEAVRIILSQGTIQLSAKERQRRQEEFEKEVYLLASNRLTSKITRLPVTGEMVHNICKSSKLRPRFKPGLPPKAAAITLANKLSKKFPDQLKLTSMRIHIEGLKDGDMAEIQNDLFNSITATKITQHEPSTVTFLTSTADYRQIVEFCESRHNLVIASAVTLSIDDDEDAAPPPAKSQDSAGTTSDSDEVLEEESSSGDELLSSSTSDETSSNVLNLSRRELRENQRAKEKRIRAHERKRLEREKLRKAEEAAAIPPPVEPSPPPAATPTSLTWCAVCEADYGPVGLRQHFKEAWHVFNQKRRFKGLTPVSADDYRDLAHDLKEGFLAVD